MCVRLCMAWSKVLLLLNVCLTNIFFKIDFFLGRPKKSSVYFLVRVCCNMNEFIHMNRQVLYVSLYMFDCLFYMSISQSVRVSDISSISQFQLSVWYAAIY